MTILNTCMLRIQLMFNEFFPYITMKIPQFDVGLHNVFITLAHKRH